MIKLLLGLAIVAFTSFCGYLLAGKYRRRKQFFIQLHAFNERFLSEIAYYRRPLGEFVAGYEYKGEFRELLFDYFQAIKDREGRGLFLTEEGRYAFLKSEEKRTVEDYFLMLGKGDSASQRGYFSTVKSTLASLRQDAEEQAKRYGDLFIKLGFLCGLLLLILIV